MTEDYPARVRELRKRLGMTQMRMAEQLGVSFATVNRWENGKSKPAPLAWRRLLDLDAAAQSAPPPAEANAPHLDFAGNPDGVAAVAEAHRLAQGHLANPAFAAEISSIDPLPHQRIAVYQHMLDQTPLRFLLADDAGAGKTIMTGLYIREALSRRRIERILVVPPAGLVGNWEREMRTLFRLPFRIAGGADARAGNPFAGPESDRLIVSIDTLAGETMRKRMREAALAEGARPYDLVVFDEAHKLTADREGDGRIRKTQRYLLAEALAGLPVQEAWRLGWSAPNLLLLTATPHQGKDFPWYCLWRLLAPGVLTTFDAFEAFPDAERRRHFIRRTKEEMLRLDGRPLYPKRRCDTLSYDLAPAEQDLYDETTRYLKETWNQAQTLNRSAARLAMSVFQRRLASSTYALMRSFERRLERIDEALELVRSGRSDELKQRQQLLARKADHFEDATADEDAYDEGGAERNEAFERDALGGFIATELFDLQEERKEVEALHRKARRLADAGEDSKFEKLRAVMESPDFAREKLIIFTEHRDTAEFLVRRLEAFGFAGQVARIHGGLDYRAREAQVEAFRRDDARYLVATDAAGEGINLQFCWLMVNYDVPWNPARLEQRMGRIHRYGQKRDPVVIVNLIAGATREGRVLKVLLEKLEAIRKQLRSDKVFDVVGQQFRNKSLKRYLEEALLAEDGARSAARDLDRQLTPESVAAIDRRDRDRYGSGDVRERLPEVNKALETEQYRRLLPGHVQRFVETAAPLIDLRLKRETGEEGFFDLAPGAPRAADRIRAAMDAYPEAAQGRMTTRRPKPGDAAAIWMHPGEPVFDAFRGALLERQGREALRGAIFVDPLAERPWLFHLAQVSVLRRDGGERAETVESRLLGLRQEESGAIARCPPEHLLLLRGDRGTPPGGVPLAQKARKLTEQAEEWVEQSVRGMAARQRGAMEESLPERSRWTASGFDHRISELMAERRRLNAQARGGDPDAARDLARVREEQRRLEAAKRQGLARLRAEPLRIEPGDATMLLHALVVPTEDPEERKRHDADVERIAMEFARAHEEAAGATVQDVSRPELARRQGLGDWPGFDLRSRRPGGEERAIEVKGRAGSGEVRLSDNEWSAACSQRDRYWLYVVFDCATARPRLVQVPDPFGRLVIREGGVIISVAEIEAAAA